MTVGVKTCFPYRVRNVVPTSCTLWWNSLESRLEIENTASFTMKRSVGFCSKTLYDFDKYLIDLCM